MAWMRLMGADSVAYHKETVLSRGDDYPGQALDYYASRGETPLAWGGSGAERLGLSGSVTEAQYEAVYGPGGACDPTTGIRLTKTLRPGMGWSSRPTSRWPSWGCSGGPSTCTRSSTPSETPRFPTWTR